MWLIFKAHILQLVEGLRMPESRPLLEKAVLDSGTHRCHGRRREILLIGVAI
jgi:hypothetical protein